MNSENDNFDQIQRMLKLKRYESPPPRYFNDFSSQIINRIRAGELGHQAAMDRSAWQATWFQRFLSAFANRPGLSGAFAAAICAVFVGGVLYSERADIPPAGLGMSASAEMLAPVSASAGIALNQTGDMALLAASSTNPIVQSTGSLFDQIRLTAQQVPPGLTTFQLNGGN